jgi:CubicO group peptidase (beta-lactamase class C family)
MRSTSRSALPTAFLLGAASVWPAATAAQTPPATVPEATAAPAVDGRIRPGEWARALEISDFAALRPAPGDPPAARTRILLTRVADTLFVAVEARGPVDTSAAAADPSEASVGAPGADWVSLALDTYGDGMEAYLFVVSSRGGRADGLMMWDGRPDTVPDFRWSAVTARTEAGFSTEISLPLEDLSYDDGPNAVWGVRLTRWIDHAKQEVIAPRTRPDGGPALEQTMALRLPGLPSNRVGVSESAPRAPTSPPSGGSFDTSTLEGRGAAWGEVDITDYELFPARTLRASRHPHPFPRKSEDASIRSILERYEYRPGKRIGDLDRFLTRSATAALLVVRRDTLVVERYANGYGRSSLLTSFSVAKSFVSTLVGIAIDQGLIGSVDDPVTKYVPELAERDARFQEIRIRHLLSMRSGLRYDESPPHWDDAVTYYSPDLRTAALSATAPEVPPGTRFLYNNYNPLLLGLVLERATRRSPGELLQEWLWEPLGMEYDGSWSLDSDASRFEKMESGINARAVDFAKLGRLYLEDGGAGGGQVVSREWVTTASQPAPRVEDTTGWDAGRRYYKYFWWGIRRGAGPHDFMALGNRGQFVYVSPQEDVVIVRLGVVFGLSSDRWVDLFRALSGAVGGS